MSAIAFAVSAAWSVAAFAVVVVATIYGALKTIRGLFFNERTAPSKCSIAFFHPYCDAGGGGERVLWCAIQSLASMPNAGQLKVVVYTGDIGKTPEAILDKAQERFGLTLSQDLDLEFVYVDGRSMLEAKRYPRFTMLGQSAGSMLLAWRCLRLFTPDIFVDTTGCHFTFLVAKLLAGCRVGCYVHYPTITTEMLQAVYERRPSYNNDSAVSGSSAATAAKALYYRAFAWLYRFAGGFADVVLCNSSWTKGHIDQLWNLPGGASTGRGGAGGTAGRVSVSTSGGGASAADTDGSLSNGVFMPSDGTGAIVAPLMRALGAARRPASRTVYPPCNTDALDVLPLGGRERLVISVAQFRPEKDHPLQLRAFARFRARDAEKYGDVKLLLVGGCRGEEDEARVAALKTLAAELGLAQSDDVEFLVNAPLDELRSRLGSARAGLHTMWNEHFGISVVEIMAAGAVTIAHNTAGPKLDIVVPFHGRQTGFLAATEAEYADALAAVFEMGEDEFTGMTAAARASVSRFSDEEFSLAWYAGVAGLVRDGMGDLKARRLAAAER